MGSRLVQDINPAGSSSPNELISINGMLFFSAELEEGSLSSDNSDSNGANDEDEASDSESETSDSTSDAESTATPLTAGSVGLMRSDGTNEGTTVLKSFDSVTNLVNAGGKLYFIAGTNNQYQLWSSDGTIRGTQPVKNLYPNADPNYPQDLFEIDGVLFYSAIDGDRDGIESIAEGGIGKYPYTNGYEVWRREGNGVGSRFFRNLVPDRLITEIEVSDDDEDSATVELILDENGDPIELTTTTTVNTIVGNDGFTTTTTTTEAESYINGKIETLVTTETDRSPTDPRNVTTTEVTETVKQSSTNPAIFLKTITTVTTTVDIEAGLTTTTTVVDQDFEVGGVVTTESTTSSTQETFAPTDLNRTDVSIVTSYASRLSFPAKITTTTFVNDSFPSNFVGINGNYFFTAQSSAYYSIETVTSDILVGGLDLWFSDGTEGGTRPINVNQNSYSYYEPEDGEYTTSQLNEPEFGFKTRGSSSFPRELTPAKNQLYFVANDGNTGFELWSISDQGSKLSLISDLHPGNTGSSPEDLTMVGKNLYFSANDGNGRELYYFNRSLDEPKRIRNAGDNPDALTAIGNKLYYSAESDLGRELWSAKGSKAKMVKDINPGSESSSPNNFTLIKRVAGDKSARKKSNYLYFSANDGTHGDELMSLKLTRKGSKVTIESDISEGPQSSLPRELTIHDQQLFFAASNLAKGRELWTVGPSIQGPTGEAGADKTETLVLENETFVYQFNSKQSDPTSWKISGGPDESLFTINSNSGALNFKTAPDFERPDDHNSDNTYEIFVRSTAKKSGYKADQKVLITVANASEDNDPETDTSGDEILYYTENCGPITANGPLYPCAEYGGTATTSGSSGSTKTVPNVSGSSDLDNNSKSNYNSYNSQVDDFNSSNGDCNDAEWARIYANSQLDNGDPTLAEHFNKYLANTCDNVSELIV